MKTTSHPRSGCSMPTLSTAAKVLAVGIAAVALAGCKHFDDDPVEPTTFSLVDPAERHPILVSQQPKDMTIRVARGSGELTPAQRAHLIEFVRRYRATDAGSSKLVIQAPSGSSNDVASMNAVGEIRHLIAEQGFDETSVVVEPYRAEHEAGAPIRISYLRYIAQAPECGRWPTNLAREPYNLPFPNMGCANQRNFAAAVANPADLLGPRTMTPRPGERRDAVWAGYVKGESTTANKKDDERVKTDTKN